MPNNTNCSRHCAFKLSGFMDHNNVDVKRLNLCLDEFQTLNPMRNRLKKRERINKRRKRDFAIGGGFLDNRFWKLQQQKK